MKSIEVYELGIEVLIDGDIPATITGITIRPAENGVKLSYEVTWWDERTRRTEWVWPFEVRTKEDKHRQVTFKP